MIDDPAAATEDPEEPLPTAEQDAPVDDTAAPLDTAAVDDPAPPTEEPSEADDSEDTSSPNETPSATAPAGETEIPSTAQPEAHDGENEIVAGPGWLLTFAPPEDTNHQLEFESSRCPIETALVEKIEKHAGKQARSCHTLLRPTIIGR